MSTFSDLQSIIKYDDNEYHSNFGKADSNVG